MFSLPLISLSATSTAMIIFLQPPSSISHITSITLHCIGEWLNPAEAIRLRLVSRNWEQAALQQERETQKNWKHQRDMELRKWPPCIQSIQLKVLGLMLLIGWPGDGNQTCRDHPLFMMTEDPATKMIYGKFAFFSYEDWLGNEHIKEQKEKRKPWSWESDWNRIQQQLHCWKCHTAANVQECELAPRRYSQPTAVNKSGDPICKLAVCEEHATKCEQFGIIFCSDECMRYAQIHRIEYVD